MQGTLYSHRRQTVGSSRSHRRQTVGSPAIHRLAAVATKVVQARRWPYSVGRTINGPTHVPDDMEAILRLTAKRTRHQRLSFNLYQIISAELIRD